MGINLPQLAPASTDRVSGALVVDGSLKLDSTSQTYFTKTFGTVGNRRTFTWSCWLKLADPGTTDPQIFGTYTDGNNRAGIYFDSSEGYKFGIYSRIGGTSQLSVATDRVFRDYSGWTHFLINVDTTQSTSTNRVKIYINGEQQTALSQTTYPSQNYELDLNITTTTHYFNKYGGADYFVDGYASQFNFIDGQALDSSYFGYTDPLTNTWRPKKASSSILDSETILVGTPTYPSDFTSTGNKTSDQTGLSFGSWTSGSYTGAETKIFKNSTDTAFTLNIGLVGGTTDRYLWGSNDLTNWTYIANAGSTYYQLSGYKYYATSEGSGSTTLHATGDGHNTFYLPFDGNTPIGQDQSGRGNDWTPVNFGGSNTIEKATGALPILNTGNGGNVARPGVFGSEVGFRETVSSSSGSGNPYIFDTRGTQPVLSFIRGATYVFDYSSATSHPLRFATAADAAGSTEYTDGTSVSGNVISFTVPHNAPDTLYYYCTNHSGMGNSISVTTDTKKADPYAWKCILAVPGAGGDYTDVSAQINCTSTTKSSSAGGDPSSDSSSNFYGSSIDLDGNDKVTYTRTNAGDFSGQNDFTIEAWFNTDTTSATDAALFSNWDSGNNRSILFGPNASGAGKFTFVFNTTGSGSWTTVANPTAYAGKWVHVAWVYDHSATRHYAYINGILQGSATGTAYNNSTANFILGVNAGDGTGYYNGKVQDLRYYHAVKYTASGTTAGEQVFIPASTDPDILPDTPSGVATKTQLKKITDGAVSFDNTGDYLSLSQSDDFSFGTGAFTCEAYCYFNTLASDDCILEFRGDGGSGDGWVWYINGSAMQVYDNGSITASTTTLGTKKWYHLAISRTSSGTLYYFVDGVAAGTATWTAATANTNGLRIGTRNDTTNSFDGYMSNVRVVKDQALYTTNFTPPSRALTTTSQSATASNVKLLCCQSNSSAGRASVSPNISGINNGTVWSQGTITGTSGGSSVSITSPGAAFDGGTDNGASFTHVANQESVITWTPPGGSLSGTNFRIYCYQPQGTSGANMYLSINGGSYVIDSGNWATVSANGTGWSTSQTIPAGTLTSISLKLTYGGASTQRIRAIEIDGTVLTDPVAYLGNASAVTLNPFTTDINTVRGQEGSYCTWNPLDKNSTASLSNGNLNWKTVNGNGCCRGTISVSSGKWYFEFLYVEKPSGGGTGFGILSVEETKEFMGGANAPDGYQYYSEGGSFEKKYNNGTATDYGDSFAPGDTISVALDMDNGTITFYKNGVSQGQAFSGISGTYAPATASGTGTGTAQCVANFGQKPFKFPPPDGFQPLTSSTVRPDTVITRPDQYVRTTLYTGNGASSPGGSGGTQAIDVGHKPDLIWIKDRTEAHNHNLLDTIRGVNSILMSDSSVTEVTDSTDAVTSFNSNGFTLGDNGEGTQSLELNKNGNNYVVWSWKAGGSGSDPFYKDDVGYATAAAAGITDGTAALTGASVGTKQGFSIVKWTTTGNGQSFSHALITAPDFIIAKSLNGAHSWRVFHKDLTAGQNLLLDVDNAQSSYDDDLASVTSTVVNVAGGGPGSTLGPNIAYCWHDVPGLQKFGIYTGNGSADGTFVELGFRPAVIMLKRTDSTSSWQIRDTTRSPNNVVTENLYPNLSNAESTSSSLNLDILSNGFKPRTSTDGGSNASGGTYIYAAWAEAPQFNLYGATSNAR